MLLAAATGVESGSSVEFVAEAITRKIIGEGRRESVSYGREMHWVEKVEFVAPLFQPSPRLPFLLPEIRSTMLRISN